MQNDDLHRWFSLSYASFAVMPRVLMYEMPDEWQSKMAELLNEFDEEFTNLPEEASCFTIRSTINGKLFKMPYWLKNYRHPDREQINKYKR